MYYIRCEIFNTHGQTNISTMIYFFSTEFSNNTISNSELPLIAGAGFEPATFRL